MIRIAETVSTRLIAQQIAFAHLKNPSEVVAYLGAMQAQEFAMAKWAIGLRSQGLKEKDIDLAFNSGKILRTHILRPTWHFVTPNDIKWILKLTAPRVKQANAFMYRQCGLDAVIFNCTNDIIANSLEGGRHLTRKEIQTILANHKIKADGFKLSYIMMQCELDGIICSGPLKGKQFTYALLDERVRNTKILTTHQALKELTLRYFTSRAHATAKDFSYWSGLTLNDAKEGILLNESALTKKIIQEEEYYFSPKKSLLSADAQTSFLMPDYDEYGMSYKDRKAITHPGLAGKIAYNRMLMIDGMIAGSWKRTIKGNKVIIDIKTNITVNKTQVKKIELASEKYAAFINKELEIVIQ